MAIEHLVLHPGEEGLHDAVIDAVAFPGHGLPDAFVFKSLPVFLHPVLPSLIGMKYEAFDIRMIFKCPVKHIGDLLIVGMKRQVKTDDLVGVHVKYRRKVALAEGKIELRYVGGPLLIGL